MEMIADGLLIAGALAAAFYCWILSGRIRKLTDLDSGVGAAIGSLSAQVEEMQRALSDAKSGAGDTFKDLEARVASAREASEELSGLIRRARAVRMKPSEPEEAPAMKKAPAEAPAQQAKEDIAERVAEVAPPPEPAPQAPPVEEAAPRDNVRALRTAVEAERMTETPEPQADEDPVQTAARKLQQDIRERVTGRAAHRDRDDFVKALHTVLAAANR